MTLAWDDADQYIIRQVCIGDFDAAELDRAFSTATAMLDSATRPVDMIVLVAGFRLPAEIASQFPNIARRSFWHHPNLGRVVIAGADSFVTMMLEVFKQVYTIPGARLSAVRTIDQAYQRLAAPHK